MIFNYNELLIRKHIPNFLTSLNLIIGCIGIALVNQNQPETAAWCIGIAAVFDFLDGLAARLLNVKSEIGKQLDSLADIVSFGLLPGFILYHMMIHSNDIPVVNFLSINVFPMIAFLIPVFSALRLAKFNIDTRQTDSFIGLPTPANALFIASLPFILNNARTSGSVLSPDWLLSRYYILVILTIILSIMLVSNIHLFSLKVKNLKWSSNKAQFILLLFSLISILTLKFLAIPFIIIIYIILSLIFKD